MTSTVSPDGVVAAPCERVNDVHLVSELLIVGVFLLISSQAVPLYINSTISLASQIPLETPLLIIDLAPVLLTLSVASASFELVNLTRTVAPSTRDTKSGHVTTLAAVAASVEHVP
jgi:hypothetical protein